MTKIDKHRLLRLAKTFFRKHPGSVIHILHTMLPDTGEVGSVLYSFEAFKEAIDHALSFNAEFKEVTFEVRR